MNKLDRLLNKADQFKESGKFKEALSTLSKANKLSPNDPYVYLSYAVTFDMMEQFHHSLKYYSLALNLKENDPKILTQYGITLCRLNRIDEAIHVFIRSIGIDPGYSLAVWHLAIAYKATGLYEEAIGLFEQCMKEDYDQWFNEVCTEGFEPVRTWIGSDLQNPVTLTRQDWRGGGLFDGDLGIHHLEVKSPGTYRITCRWSDVLAKTHPVLLRLNEKEYENVILRSESQARFDEVVLAEGPCKLEAWVEIEGEKCGFRFIEIEKLK